MKSLTTIAITLLFTVGIVPTIQADSRELLCKSKMQMMTFGYINAEKVDTILIALTSSKLSKTELLGLPETVFNILTGKQFRQAGLVDDQGNVYSKSAVYQLGYKNCMNARQS